MLIKTSKQAKTKRLHEHYCSDRHNGTQDWVITLIDSADSKSCTGCIN